MDPYKITFASWNKVAQIYQDKFMNLALYNDAYDFYCDQFNEECPKILEIGCGPGNITRYMISKNPTFDIHAIDIAPNMIRLAKINNPTATFEVMDLRDIDGLEKKFHGIVCGFCIPYLSKIDCVKMVQDNFDLMNKNGIFFYSFIEGDYHNAGFQIGSTGDRMFVYYYSVDFFERLLRKYGFEMLKVFRVGYPENEVKEVHVTIVGRRIN